MSKPKVKTTPDLIEISPAHKSALLAGREHFESWQFNVTDELKNKTNEEIKKHLKDTAYPFAIAAEHIIRDFNLGTVIRNANVFNAREVFYLGEKKWDRRSAVGVFNYTPIQWLATLNDFILLKKQYKIIGIDNISGAKPLESYQWEDNSLLVFGEEGVGLTPMMQSLCEDMVYIPQFGSVRSLNVGTASGIIMHDFVTKYRARNKI